MMRRAALLVLPLALLACGGDDQRTADLDPEEAREKWETLDPAVRIQIERGNRAFRESRYDSALVHYTNATRLDEGAAAGWFGVYMAQLALGNPEAAADALARARAAAPGTTLVTPEEEVEP